MTPLRSLFRTILSIIFLAGMVHAGAQPVWDAPDDLLGMVKQMQTNFPKLKEMDQLDNTFEYRRDLARGAYFPIVGADINYQYVIPVSEFSVGPEVIQVFPNHNYSAQIFVKHPIWDFGKTKANIDKVDNEETQFNHTREFTELNLSYQLANLYYGILFLEKSLAIQDSEMVAARESERITESRFKSGEALEVDLLNTRVRIEQIQNRKTDIQSSIDKQRGLMKYLTGNDYSTFRVDVNTPFPGADALSPEAADPSFAENVDVVAAQDKLLLAKNDVQLNSKMGYPTFSFMASGGLKNGYIPDLIAPKANLVTGVGMSFPFFAGFRFRSMTKISRNQVAVAELGRESALAEAEKNYDQAVKDFSAVQEKLQRTDNLIATAEKALKITNSRYVNGLITSYELILAQNNLENAKMAKVQLEYQRWQSLLEINRIVGTKYWE